MKSISSQHFISFIVPAYNVEGTIERCIESILSCNYSKELYEVIVVDNNSRDSTVEKIKKYPVQCLFESRQGRSFARNKGILASKGDLIAFVDADCMIDKDWANELEKKFILPYVGSAQGKIFPYVDPKESNSLRFFHYEYSEKISRGTFILLDGMRSIYPCIDTAAAMYRRKALIQVGLFNTHLKRHEDAELTHQVMKCGYTPCSVLQASATCVWYKMVLFSLIKRYLEVGYYYFDYLDVLSVPTRKIKLALGSIRRTKWSYHSFYFYHFLIVFSFHLGFAFRKLFVGSFLFRFFFSNNNVQKHPSEFERGYFFSSRLKMDLITADERGELSSLLDGPDGKENLVLKIQEEIRFVVLSDHLVIIDLLAGKTFQLYSPMIYFWIEIVGNDCSMSEILFSVKDGPALKNDDLRKQFMEMIFFLVHNNILG